jgi:hypothetical protein
VSRGLDAAVAAKPAVVELGGAFMISPEMKAAVKGGGYRGWSLYMAGRAGVLGPTSSDVVGAALGFFSPDLVRPAWEAGLAVRPVEQTHERYVAVCRDWGRNRYSRLEGVERLADLLGRVVEAADPVGWPLYAGWRGVPLPEDAPARVAQLVHVLREHRGGAHLFAVRSAGLTPLEAILAGDGGAGNAAFFGWSTPFPQVDVSARRRRDRAEELTDELVAPAYAVLAHGEHELLPELLGRAAAAVNDAAA